MAARRKYPWELWFSRPRVVIVRGIDYDCSQATMVQSIRNAASIRGVGVGVQDKGTAISIEVRNALPHPDPPPVPV